jgi:hypothetical protein
MRTIDDLTGEEISTLMNRGHDLPEKLWELTQLALEDLEKVEQDEKHYRVHMASWHEPYEREDEAVCYVCLAGAVLAKTIKVPRDLLLNPSQLGCALDLKMCALNALRLGDVVEALEHFHGFIDKDTLRKAEVLQDPGYVDYGRSPHGFKDWLRNMIAGLKEMNL